MTVLPESATSSPANVLGSEPLISVIITSYTLRRLPDALESISSLSRQTHRRIEIIFVPEGPAELKDRVEAFARERGIVNLRIVLNQGPRGLSYARNVGVGEARGDIIAFVDDDIVAANDWAERIVETFIAWPEAIGLTGQALPVWCGEKVNWFPPELDWVLGSTQFTGWRELRVVRNAFGMNMAFRREAFRYARFSESHVGGNQGDPSGIKRGLLGDDTQFSLDLLVRTGRPILFAPNVTVYNKVHPYRLRPEFVRRRAFWEGYTKATLVRNHRAGSPMKLSNEAALLKRILLGLIPRTLGRLVWHPVTTWLTLTFTTTVLFHLALGYLSARCAVIGRALVNRYA